MLPPTQRQIPPAALSTTATLATPRSRLWRYPTPTRVRRALRLALYALALTGMLVVVGPVSPSVQQDIAAGNAARTSLRYDRALWWYAVASGTDPSYARPQCLRGDVFMLQQEWASAESAYRHCATLAPADAGAWLALGDALTAESKATDAMTAWRRSAALGGPTALRRLGLADEAAGRLTAAAADWKRLPASDPEALAHLGLLAILRGDSATAQRDIIAARATPNKYADMLMDNGFVYFAAQPPQNSVSFAQLGYDFLTAGMPGLALAPLRQSVTLDPANGAAHAYLGWTLWQRGQQAEARVEIANGLALAPASSFACYAAAQVAFADGDYTRAYDLDQQGLQLDGRNPALWAAEGQAALALRDYVHADLALSNAAQLSNDPSFTVTWLRLYSDLGLGLRDGRARFAVSTAIARYPTVATIRYLCGQIFDHLNMPADAYYAWQAANTLDPTDPAPYVALGAVAETDGNYTTAALDLRMALALRPHGPDAGHAAQLLAPLIDIEV